MFSKKKPKKLERTISTARQDAISSIISKDMMIKGEIQFGGSTRIDGIIEGNVKGESLTLGDTGKIKGDLLLNTFICHGIVEGNLKANDVSIQSTAVIVGNINSSNLALKSGATIEGEVVAVKKEKAKKNSIMTRTADFF